MKHIDGLHSYWRNGKGYLETLVRKRSARLLGEPYLTVKRDGKAPTATVTPDTICIYNAPQKGSSTRHGKSHKLAIFVGGELTLHVEEEPYLVSGKCDMSIYDCEDETKNFAKLTLLDAMHFDMEPERKPFHPIFHVQRGRSNSLTAEVIKDLVHLQTRAPKDAIEVDEVADLGSAYLRLPTPQLDFFSVLTVIAADYFCNPGEAGATMQNFKTILKWLTDKRNAASPSRAERELIKTCQKKDSFSAAWWYPESAA